MKKLFIGAATVCMFAALNSFAFPRGNDEFSNDEDYYQLRKIAGRVVDSKGTPLAGATIQVSGANIITLSDDRGNFSIDIPDDNSKLEISYTGKERKIISVSGMSALEVVLHDLPKEALDEVVVVGYSATKKANLTGAVASVNGAKLNQRPAPNAANLLQGRVAGLEVIQPSAEPGRDNPNFLIRGRGSFAGGTNNGPLILIDGVTGSINNLAPQDIENVTVLKDAASASIYGARGANGVILVTTKKGKRGPATVSYRFNAARHSPTALPDFITNSAEYMEMYNQAAARSGIAFRYPQTEIDKYRNATDREQYPNFNSVDYYINPALVTNHSLSISGGNEKSLYNLSLGYLNQDAMIKNYKFRRYNVLLNYSNEVARGITVGTSMNLTYKDRDEPPFTGEGMALSIYAAGPLYGPFLPDGSGRVVSRAYNSEGRNRNPQEYFIMGEQTTQEYNLNAQAYADIKFGSHFVWTTKFALNYVDEFYKMHQVPYDAFLLQEKNAATGDYVRATFGPDILGVTDQYGKSITPTIYSTLNYQQKFGDHSVTGLAGYEQVYSKYQVLRGRRTSSVAPSLTELTGYTNAGEQLFFTHPRLPSLSGPSEWALQSFFGRGTYSYKNKYLLEANLRYDGTSRVAPDFRWGLFPSVSAGWVVSKENFFSDNVNWISHFKLRASYGTLGNQDVGNYLYQDNLSINVFYPLDNTTVSQGGVINQFRDQSLTWESTAILDFGFDLSIKNGLFGLTFDWFNKKTYDILATQPVPMSLGLTAPTTNDGKMQNRGIELELTHQNTVGEVTYGANFLISTAKNKVLSIKTPSYGTTINEVGLPYGSHYLYIWDGVFQESDIGNSKVPRHVLNPNPKPGDLKMKDMNGDGVVDANDRTVVDGVYAKYNYSFGFNVGYKNFQLNAFLQGVQGVANRVTNWGIDPFMQGTAPTTKWRNAWTPQNPTNTLPAIYIAGYSGVAAYSGSTYYLQDASYLRLKNVMLTYTFPSKITKAIHGKGLSVYVSADNLFTITDYEGGDPERVSRSGNFSQYPQAIIVNGGFNVQF